MQIDEIRKTITTSEYDFLRDHPNLGASIALIGLGGSHAYGTNREDSDLDIRGVATNLPKNILTGRDFEQVVDVPTDTVMYSVDKLFKLLCQCNPNTIEILGLKPEHYLYKNKVGEMILQNRSLFLSKVCIRSFGGYASDQLRRMENKAASVASQAKQQENILKSIRNSMYDFRTRHYPFPDDGINLFIDKSVTNPDETEIFMDISLHHYPLKDHYAIYSEMNQIIKDYKKGNNHRNTNAIGHDKLGKHMMHLVRLYLMCFDILENGEIITYREKDLEFLNTIRRGDYLDGKEQPTKEFYELLDELEKRFQYAQKHTTLPDKVDTEKVFDLLAEINSMVVKGEV